ncbi:hypothetical protein BBK36DRAFT_21753 [Trichoderma citrinoviride]|uniref:Uncharacterized protein n=1 Tax=Trichoderma citrinoviride TaxID=58853 RepID=A0A2T4B443_9HYPO|nr:hypothetical protein BBK36DRAFT_21753 [Trichoderma citrinoviride]PTB64106.1 hypothetical protein BBK36DRAFT_21753 [Trichoderma citrinoviride]
MAAAPASATLAISNSPPPGDSPAKPDAATESSATPGPQSETPIRTSSHDVTDVPDGASIHTTDGRVKNPVPSKLKGKADNKNGNFGVMHIDINSSQAALRNAAAKRTSEETEAAARLANMRGYQSIKRSKLAWIPPSESDPRSSAPAYGATQNGYLNTAYPLPARALGPLPHEAKAEQARLLTLLRSLNPLVVVDQLCKALAYFGGIPGAPSSHDCVFPESQRNNGQGSIFVGWVAEIFPPVEGNPTAIAPHPSLQSAEIVSAAAAAVAVASSDMPASSQPSTLSHPATAPPAQPTSTDPAAGASKPPEAQNAPAATPVKRPRGRPKGSKSSKPRIDKGIKKSDLAHHHASSQADGHGSHNALNLSQNEPGSSEQRNGLPNPAFPGDISAHLDPDSSIVSTPGTGKKRGRPKGSKNRPKNTPDASQAAAATDAPQNLLPAPATSNAIAPSPLSHKSTGSMNNISSFANTMPPRADQHQQQNPSPTMQEGAAVQHGGHMGVRNPQTSQTASIPAVSSWAGSGMQSLDQYRSANNHSHPKKRKVGDPAQVARDSLSAITAPDASSQMRHGDEASLQMATADSATMKRRRVSRESLQNPIFSNIDTQSGRVGMNTSPILNNSYNSISQAMATNNFDSQLASAAVRKASTQQHLQQQQQQHHPQRSPTQAQGQNVGQSLQNQQQPQQFTSQRPQQQNQGMRPPQLQQGGHMPPGSSRPRPGQMYGNSPTGITSQGFYAQTRQLPGQLGHVAGGGGGGSFARGAGSGQAAQFGPSSMARQSSDDRAVNLSQQAALAVSRSQAGQQQTPTARHPSSGFTNGQQVSATSTSASVPTTSSLSQFQNFGEHSYLDMDYGLNERDVQDAAAAFGDSTQLEAALADGNMRERLYQAMTNRQ